MNIEIASKDYEKNLNWYDSTLYCELLVIDGKNDWRLPTKDELNEISNSENDFDDLHYWSATVYSSTRAWFQSMSYEYRYQHDYPKYNSLYVRPVRNLTT